MSRTSWFDEESQVPQIEQYARSLTSFTDALADGKIDEAELKAQEARVTSLMKEVEPQLDDNLHAKVTQLLCELTAYDLMQLFHEMQKSRRKTVFHG
jgi:hypothetical protein